MKVALNLVKSSGTLSLWRGAGPALASALIDNTVLFTLQRAIQRVIAPGVTTEASLSTVQHAICGGMAGLCSATAICPAELVKCRMQGLGPSAGTSGLSIASGILRVEGISGLFRGWLPLVVRDVPLQTIFFGSYKVHSAWLQYLSDILSGESKVTLLDTDPTPQWRAFLAGGLAGSTSWLVIFPLDVLKSRMQTEILGSGQKMRLSMKQTFHLVMKEGGPGAFYRGVFPAVVRAFPANAALFWGVELASTLLRDY